MKTFLSAKLQSDRGSLRPVLYGLFTSITLTFASVPAAGQATVQDVISETDELFNFATPETPGCAVGVSQHGEVVVNRTYGLADVEHRRLLTPSSKFDIGSVHKQFVAAAVLLLVEDGRLSLTNDIRAYLPELADYGHTVTVDHLLTHTSGIRDWTVLLPLAEDGVDVLTLILRQQGLNFVPGDEWQYSNSGYVLLKEIVSRVSGMPFAEFARQRLFEPLGMTSSAYVADILQGTGEHALAYQKEDTDWQLFMRLGNRRGGGTVISTAADLLIWNDALTNGQLGAFVTEKLEEPATLNNGRELTYGRGLRLDSIPGERLVWHDGGADGYGTWLGRFAENGLSLVVMCNFEPVSVGGLVTRVADLFLPPVDPEAQPPGPVAAPGVDVTGREGFYFEERSGDPLRLVVNNGRLTIAGWAPLVPVSEDRFRPPRASLWVRSQDEFELVFRSNDELELTSMEGEVTRYHRAEPWTPTAADLEAVDGRYGSEELGQVFEIVPGPSGLVFRSERTPEKAIVLQPVAYDAYMHQVALVRFRRDATGRVTGFEHNHPAMRNMAFTRLGDRAASSPPVFVPEDRAPATPADTAPQLEGLVGEYEMAPGRTIAITLEDGQLHGEPTGNPKRPLVHVSGTTFTVGQVDAPITVTFTLDADGRTTAIVVRQNGNERTLPRVQ